MNVNTLLWANQQINILHIRTRAQQFIDQCFSQKTYARAFKKQRKKTTQNEMNEIVQCSLETGSSSALNRLIKCDIILVGWQLFHCPRACQRQVQTMRERNIVAKKRRTTQCASERNERKKNELTMAISVRMWYNNPHDYYSHSHVAHPNYSIRMVCKR